MSLSSDLILLNSKTAGKDKIYRTIQYGCKLLWYLLWKSRSNKEYIQNLKKIEALMSQTRKVLRFAKTHEMIEAALKNIHIDDHFLRYTLTASNLNQALYLLLDNTLLLQSIGIVELKNKEKLLEYSNKFWLFSTLLSLARDIHDLIGIIQNEELIQKQQQDLSPINKYTLNEKSGAYTSNKRVKNNISAKRLLVKILKIISIICLNKRNYPLLLDTLKNSFDILLPLNSLKFINLSPGMQGLCGLISSLIGLITIWDSKLKLKN